jgi:hypothetical protein
VALKNKKMKKHLLTFAAVVFAVSMFAQDAPKADAKKDAPKDAKKTETKMADHKCTTACKDGKHSYAHGEKGHTCTAACKK